MTWRQQADNDAVTWEYGYDLADQLTAAVKKSTDPTPAVLKRYAYGYDPAGNRTVEQIDDQVTGATYDSLNRLVSQQAAGAMAVAGTVSEPAAVMVQSKPAVVTPDNRFSTTVPVVQGTNTVTVTATDATGNTATRQYQVDSTGAGRTLTYDDNGNLIADGTRTFEWDARDRLIRVLEGGVETVRFTYDGWGRRSTKTTNGVVTAYVYDTDGIVQERIGNSRIVNYAQGNELDKAFGNVEGGAATVYMADHLRSVVKVTDGTGTVTARAEYDPFGRLTLLGGTVSYSYTGRQWDDELGLYYYRARYYSADLGRFLSVDPLPVTVRANRELNDYAYVANNPLKFTDPFGLNIHGNYCGPGGKGKAVDATDSCCQQHDQCYGKCDASWTNHVFGTGGEKKQCCMQKCDQDVCECLKKVNPKSDNERKGRSRVMWYFECNEPKRPSPQQPTK